MKKTLAIVLALVMVLCMIPAMSATTTKTVSDQSYKVRVLRADNYDELATSNGALVNSLTTYYEYSKIPAVTTGKWTENSRMAFAEVIGFDFTAKADVKSITINGKPLTVDSHAGYEWVCGAFDGGKVNFPVELTKAGYSETYYITVVSEADEVVTTETAKITLKLVNTESYKDTKTATITNIVSANATTEANTYIVGSKLYIDFAAAATENTKFKVTFADENGKAFSGITYAYNPGIKDNATGLYPKDVDVIKQVDATVDEDDGKKLSGSAVVYYAYTAANGQTIKFGLETASAKYETKPYTIVMRTGIKEEDPKGIYFAETTKTIAMGETYAPVVMGVKTGKPVAATLVVPADTDKQVVDLVDWNTAVIGTREGIAYITATYTPFGGTAAYTSSSMKIVVTLPGESIPPVEPAATIYYVTCRNLNVRKGAGTSYAKAGMIHRGDAVKVVEIAGGWAKLADGTYVCAKYIAK